MVYAVIPLYNDREQSSVTSHREIEQILRPSPEFKVYYEEKPHLYIVEFDGSSAELSKKLNAFGESGNCALIVALKGYYGFGYKDMWEWISYHEQS